MSGHPTGGRFLSTRLAKRHHRLTAQGAQQREFLLARGNAAGLSAIGVDQSSVRLFDRRAERFQFVQRAIARHEGGVHRRVACERLHGVAIAHQLPV